MASNNLDGPPPQEDPKNPNYICTNCHNNIYELCDECMERVDVKEILAMMKRNKGRPLDDGPPLDVEDESRSYVDHMKVHDSPEPPNTTPDNTQAMSENDTSDSQRECEGIHEGHDMDSDNFNYDDPITPGGFFLTPGQEKPEYESPFYDSDGNELVPGHQLF